MMKRLLLFSLSAMLLALPAASALCASCVSGPCATDGETPGKNATVAEASVGDSAKESGDALPPCHAAMGLATKSLATEAPEPAPADTPCHEPREAGATTAGLSCCSPGEVPPATQTIAPVEGQRDGSAVFAALAGQSVPGLEATLRLSVSPSQRGQPAVPRPPVALHVLKAVWLI